MKDEVEKLVIYNSYTDMAYYSYQIMRKFPNYEIYGLQSDIKEIINSLKGKYTIIMITHDMDMIDTSDNIIVLNNGEIVGMGTHNELLKTNSYYENLYYGDKDEA